MPMEKKKHPYQHKEPVELYDKTHHTPEDIKEEISDFIITLAKEFKNGSQKINILDAGIGEGSVIAIPLISKAIKNNIALNIIGFDNSSEMFNRLHQNLQNAFPKNSIIQINHRPSLFLLANFNQKVSLKVYMADIENRESFIAFRDALSNTKFHICLSFFLLHHLINWRYGLTELIDMIEDKGYFVYAERLDDIAAMDGDQRRLYELKKDSEWSNNKEKIEFYNLLKKFCSERNKILLWNPEISATNYKEVGNALKIFSIEEKKLKNDYSYDLSYDDFYKWVKDGVYTNFWWGLSTEDRGKLLNEITKNPDNNKKINIKDGLNVIAHKICKRPDIDIKEYLFVDSFLNSKVIEKIHTPVDIRVSKDESGRYRNLKNLLALISTHDLIAPTTIWSFLTYWSLTKNKFAEKMPFSVVKIDPNSIDKLIDNISYMVLYFSLIEQIEFSITQFIFRDLTERPILIIKKGEDIQYEFTKDWNDNLLFLNITIPQTRINDNKEINKFLCKAKKKIKDLLTANGLVHETRGSIVFIEWDKIFEYFKKEQTLKWDSLISNSQYIQFNSKFKDKTEAFQKDTDITLFSRVLQSSTEREGFTKVLATLGLLFSYTDLTHISYVASETVVEKNETGDIMNYGFGGAIIGERISHDNSYHYDDNEENYLRSRCRLLRTIINRRYAQFGIGEYAEKVTKELQEKAKIERTAKMFLQVTAHDINRHVLAGPNLNTIKKDYLQAKLRYFSIITKGAKGIEPDDIDKCDVLELLKEFKNLQLPIMGVNWKNVIIKRNTDGAFNIYTIKIAFFSIFENLISNSGRHSGKSKDKLEISITVEKAKNNIVLTYEDNGNGFEEEAIKNLLRWSEGDLTDDEFNCDKGTGIFATHKSVNVLGGTIQWPKKEKETQITITLPATKKEWEKLYQEKVNKKKANPGLYINIKE